MALMGANPRTVYVVTSAVGGALAGVAAALLIIQYSVHPFFGAAFGPLTFMICVLGGLGNMIGAFVAAFIMSEDHLDRRRRVVHRDGLRDRLRDLHHHDLRPAGRSLREARVSAGRLTVGALLAVLVAVPFVPMHGMKQYVLHVLIQIFVWSFIGGAWALMGRFGLVSLGHGAFLGLGAYTTTLLWNFFRPHPVARRPSSRRAHGALAVIVAYPCSRFQVIGHYFGLVTLAVGEVVRPAHHRGARLTGGSLGLTVRPEGADSLVAVQFADKRVFYYAVLVLWALGLWVWYRVDRSMARSGDGGDRRGRDGGRSVGIHVTRFKIAITVLSAVLTAWAASRTRSTSRT